MAELRLMKSVMMVTPVIKIAVPLSVSLHGVEMESFKLMKSVMPVNATERHVPMDKQSVIYAL